MQIYFDCCSTIGTRSNAFKEFLLRTERVLRDMSPIFLFTIPSLIAKKAKTQNFETFMVTPDKDFAQLVEEDIYFWKSP